MGWKDAPVVENGKKAGWESAPAVEKPDPVSEAINRSPTAGLVDAAGALASGAVAAPVAGLAGIAGTLLPGQKGQGAEWVRKTQDALTYEPKTKIGKTLVNAVSYPFEKVAELGDKAGEKVADSTGSPAAGAMSNAFVQSVPLVLGKAKPVVGEGAEALAKRKLQKAQNAGTDAALTAAKESGYVVPPTQANPSLLNQILEGAAGKIKTAQKASEQNQGVTNGLVRKAIGVGEDQPLNTEALNAVRKKAGEAYERVRGAGTVTPDQTYFATLDSIREPFARAAKDFPDAARTDILDAVQAAKRDSFDASSAVDQIRILREKADQAYAGKDKSLGKAYKEIAGAMEDQLGRHIEKLAEGNEYSSKQFSPQDIEAFRNARETIAKSYTVQKHLQANGNVDAKGLASDLKRKPLSAELKTVAEFGKNFPKAAQLPEKIGGVPMSPWEHAAGVASVAGAVMTGHPGLALAGLAPYARPAVRSGILSGPYQSRFVNPQTYEPRFRNLEQLLEYQTPGMGAVEMAEGQRK